MSYMKMARTELYTVKTNQAQILITPVNQALGADFVPFELPHPQSIEANWGRIEQQKTLPNALMGFLDAVAGYAIKTATCNTVEKPKIELGFSTDEHLCTWADVAQKIKGFLPSDEGTKIANNSNLTPHAEVYIKPYTLEVFVNGEKQFTLTYNRLQKWASLEEALTFFMMACHKKTPK